MPPSLLSANLARRAICPEWPAFHTRPPHPDPLPREREPIRGYRIPLLSQQGKESLFMDAGNMLEIFTH